MLKLTPEAIKYILLQRTQFKEGVTPEEIEAGFRRDFETYARYLPVKCDSIVDIGSGIGIQNILLAELCESNYIPPVKILMIDKTKTEDNIWYGFQKEGAFYNSLSLSKHIVEDNSTAQVRVHEALPNYHINADNESVDLVTSFISWGFHYPIETYLDEVIRVMKPGATLIVDVRKHSGGWDKLEEQFGEGMVIQSFQKYNRIMFKKVI